MDLGKERVEKIRSVKSSFSRLIELQMASRVICLGDCINSVLKQKQPLLVSLGNSLMREQDISNQTITLRDQPFWGDFNGTPLIFSVCQFKAVLFGLFPATLFCSYINCTPFEWMELVISFYLEQPSPVIKQPGCSGTYQESTSL